MAYSKEELQEIGRAVADAQSPLRDVTLATARTTLSNLIQHDREWGAKVMAGEAVATSQYQRLIAMSAEHEQAVSAEQVKTATAAWNKQQADLAAAKMADEDKVRAAVDANLLAGAAKP